MYKIYSGLLDIPRRFIGLRLEQIFVLLFMTLFGIAADKMKIILILNVVIFLVSEMVFRSKTFIWWQKKISVDLEDVIAGIKKKHRRFFI